MPQRQHVDDLCLDVGQVVEVVLSETEKNSMQILNVSMTNIFPGVRKFLNEKQGCFEFLGEAAWIFRSVLQPPFGGDADLFPFSSSRRAGPSSYSPRRIAAELPQGHLRLRRSA